MTLSESPPESRGSRPARSSDSIAATCGPFSARWLPARLYDSRCIVTPPSFAIRLSMELTRRQHELLRVAANAHDGTIWVGKDLGGKRPLQPELEELVRLGLMVQAG